MKKISSYFKQRHLERAENEEEDTIDEYFWRCSRLEKYYRYLILLYRFYWSIGVHPGTLNGEHSSQ